MSKYLYLQTYTCIYIKDGRLSLRRAAGTAKEPDSRVGLYKIFLMSVKNLVRLLSPSQPHSTCWSLKGALQLLSNRSK